MNVMKTLLDSGQMTGAAFQSQDSSPTREMRARAHPDRMNGKNLGHCSPCSNYGRLTAPDQDFASSGRAVVEEAQWRRAEISRELMNNVVQIDCQGPAFTRVPYTTSECLSLGTETIKDVNFYVR
ncbi:hypothetical protein Mp_2g08780 [Marchantia polymorpha subsp. ruderalis]|uniref:Uncharacterized protein n=1 Tax=Marchantia polymorpha TaxID=3197 RepID=A0A2R6XGY1_MARPO|nr:hypothetical protein MARPO_0015s0163 [Marchantia polymorpha]BBN01608.1 hypothetical protein Mp_2g08780 [Marchantia polymorpha subsp. ruderalis]|eukprot:PTQ45375.1 hypothetical protein MARPO_0015s0163 [Marchantia polymorpha]